MSTAADLTAGVVFRFVFAASILFLILPVVVSVVLSFDDRTFLGAFPADAVLAALVSQLHRQSRLSRRPDRQPEARRAVDRHLDVAGACAAYVLSIGRWRGRDTVEMLFLSPKFVPTVVIGFSILGFASAIQVFDPFTRLIMGHVVITIPFTVRATLASLVGIRRSLVEAAISLGAPPWRAFLDVTLPLARTGIIAGALMAFVLSFDEVAVSLFLSDAFTQTLPIALVAEMRANLNLTVAAVSTVFAAVTILIVFFLDRAIGLDRVIGQGLYRG